MIRWKKLCALMLLLGLFFAYPLRVSAFTNTDQPVYSNYVVTGSSYVNGLAWGSDGKFYVAGDNSFFVLDSSHTIELAVARTGNIGPGYTLGIKHALKGPDGNIYVSFGGSTISWSGFSVYSPTGEYLRSFGSKGTTPGLYSGPQDFVFDDLGRIFVVDTENNRVQVVDTDGNSLQVIGESGSGNGQFNNPLGIVFDHDYNFYVTDTLNHRIQKFSKDGTFIKTIGTAGSTHPLNAPLGIAISPDGYLYVTETWGNVVSKFTLDGDYLMTFGSVGTTPGHFQNPNALTVSPAGNIYVATLTGYGARIDEYKVDLAAPSLTINPFSNDTISSPVATITGTATDDVTPITVFEYSLNAGNWHSCAPSDGILDEPIEDYTCRLDNIPIGNNTITVRAIDSRTNGKTATYTFTLDGSRTQIRLILENISAGVITTVPYTVTGKAMSVFAGAFNEVIAQTATFAGGGDNLSMNDDDQSGQFQFNNFKFPFYGQEYSSAYISSNGRICFGNGSVLTTGTLADTSCGAFIAPFWTDLGKGTRTDKIRATQTQDYVQIHWNSDFENTPSAQGVIGGGVAQGWHADDNYWTYELPFSFPFYDGTYTTIGIGSNGNVCFSTPASCSWYTNLSGTGTSGIDILGNDLRTDGTNEDIYITASDSNVIIRWQAEDYRYNHPINFEVVLFSNGSIRTNYGSQDTPPLRDGSAVGVTKGDGTHYTYSTYNGTQDINGLVSRMYTYSPETGNYTEAAVSAAPETIHFDIEAFLYKDGKITFNYASPYDFSKIVGLSAPLVGISKGDGSTFLASALSGGNFVTTTPKTTTFSEYGAGHISTVTANLDGSTAGCTAQDGHFNSSEESFSCVLSPEDGHHTMHIASTDDLHNNKQTDTYELAFDAHAPQGSITINNGAAITTGKNVTLGITATDAGSSVVSMQVSPDPLFSGASWVPYKTSTTFSLSSGNGVKTLYVRFKDANNNVSSSYSDTITLTSLAVSIVESTPTPTPSVPLDVTLPVPSPTEQQQGSDTNAFLVVDDKGNAITDIQLTVDGVTVSVSKNGVANLRSRINESTRITAVVNGSKVNGTFSNGKIVINTQAVENSNIGMYALLIIILIVVLGIVLLIRDKSRNSRKKSIT